MTRAVARDPIYRRRRFQSEVIELCVRWYLTYRLSYRDLVEMMAERGVIPSSYLTRPFCGGCSGTYPSSRSAGVAMHGACIHLGGWTRPPFRCGAVLTICTGRSINTARPSTLYCAQIAASRLPEPSWIRP